LLGILKTKSITFEQMIKKMLFFACFVLFDLDVKAQSDKDIMTNSDKKSSIRGGLNYHIQSRHMDLNPILIYSFGNNLSIGAGLNFLHYYRRTSVNGYSAVGADVFIRYTMFSNYFFHLEYLQASVPYRYDLTLDIYHVNKSSFLSGMGYKTAVFGKTEAFLFFLVDLNHSPASAYRNNFLIKGGMMF
jgi:hypothetical protein